jgi:DNA-binding XRE family transcriptional regulator
MPFLGFFINILFYKLQFLLTLINEIKIIMNEKAVKLIRQLRIEKNYSQEYVAAKLNISQSYYGRIENGKANLDLKTLYEILEAFEIDCVVFFKKLKVYQD